MLPSIDLVPLADSRQPAPRPKGVLWPAAGREVFDTAQETVPWPLSLVLEHHWWVRWRRDRQTEYRAQVLRNPVLHLTFEDGEGRGPAPATLHGHRLPAALVQGLVTRVFGVELPVAGRVSGVAFRPGGLAALLGLEVSRLTGTVVAATEVFGPEVSRVAGEVLGEPDERARQRHLSTFLTGLVEPQADRIADDPAYRAVRDAVELMRARHRTTLGPIAEAVHVSPRTLQRIFLRYVGASPLWVLRRYRLQDAAALIDAGGGEDLAELSASLGWADQAHFSREFRQVIGVPPSRYRASRSAPR